MRYLLEESPDVDLQSNTTDAVQHDANPKQLCTSMRYRVRVPDIGVPFDVCYAFYEGADLESVLLPTFVECVYLSLDGEVCPSPYCNWAEAELLWLERITVAKTNLGE